MIDDLSCRVTSAKEWHVIPAVSVQELWVKESAMALKTVNCFDFILSQNDIEEINVLWESLRLGGLDKDHRLMVMMPGKDDLSCTSSVLLGDISDHRILQD
jgi:hypothetical protein